MNQNTLQRPYNREQLPRQLDERKNGSRPVTPQDVPARGNEVMDKINILKQMLNNEDTKVKRIQNAKDKVIRGTASQISGDSVEELNNFGTPYGRPIFSRPESRNEQYLQNSCITPKMLNQDRPQEEIEISSHGEDQISNLSTPRVDTHNYSMINQKNLMEQRIAHQAPDDHPSRRQFYPKSHSVLGFSNGASGFKTVQNQQQNRRVSAKDFKVNTAMSDASGFEFNPNQAFEESSLRESPPIKVPQQNQKETRVQQLTNQIIRLVSALGQDTSNNSQQNTKTFQTIGTQTETSARTSVKQKGRASGIIAIAIGGAVTGIVFAGVYLSLKKILKLK